MTHTRQMADSEGEFDSWHFTALRCRHEGCGKPVLERLWESNDGAFEDHQYRCEDGHTWWIDGIDS
jgi:hypothetical protein